MADKTMLNVLRIRAVDEDIWRTINSAKVLIDGDDGTIKGGAGGKMNGMKYKPSWGKSAKTGKKVLKPFKAKFSHFKGTKKELFEKLKKAAEPPKPKKTNKQIEEEHSKLSSLVFSIGNMEKSSGHTVEDVEQLKAEIDEAFEAYKDSYKDYDKSKVDPNDIFNTYVQPNHIEKIEKWIDKKYTQKINEFKQDDAQEKAMGAWKDVIKAKNALKSAKILKTKLNNQHKLEFAYNEYKKAVAESPYGWIDFSPDTKGVEEILAMTPEEIEKVGYKKKAKSEYPVANKVDPFITPLTEPGYTDRAQNIQNTIKALQTIATAAKGSNSKYKPTQLEHKGKDGFVNTPVITNDMVAHKKLVDTCSKVWKGATEEEKEAITEYTQSYHKFNEPLRGIEYGTNVFKGVGNIDMDAIGEYSSHIKPGEIKSQINKMTDIIDKSSYNFDVQVRRGVSTSGAAKLLGIDESLLYGSLDDIKDAVEGKLVTEFGFCSTGVAEGKGFDGEVELRILCPAGTKMMYVEPFSHYGHGVKYNKWDGVDNQTSVGGEQEAVLQRNTRFQVQRVERKGGKVHVHLQVMMQDPVQFT